MVKEENIDGPTLYMKASRGRIAKYVIFSGDPWRVEVLKDLLEKPEHIAFAREFNTYTGTYCGVRITVTSTGIGAPSAAIAMEEMYQSGMEVAIRMGTIMGLKDDLLGKFIIPRGAMRGEATSSTYVPAGFPAVADLDLVNCMNRAVLANGREYVNGIIASKDGFYSQMRSSPLSREMGTDVQSTFDELKKYRVIGIDMESSVILTLANLMGIRGCVVTMTTVLENLKRVLEGAERTEAERILCKVVLDGILNVEGGTI
jgi:uridine phosphorylase